jgi:hypothetical protein
MAAGWTLNSVSPAKPKFDAREVRFEYGKTTLMEWAVTPRLLVEAWSTPTPLGFPSPTPEDPVPVVPVAPPAFFFDVDEVIPYTAPPTTAITRSRTPT